jgi:hypothetical protein
VRIVVSAYGKYMGNFKGWAWNADHGFTFSEMMDLVNRANVVDTRMEFSNGLLIGLFWEESVFQNWWQLGNGGQALKQFAAGFGQIERHTLGIMNALYAQKRFKYTSEMMINDPFISVCATVDYLRYLRSCFKNSTKQQILKNYGGAGNGGSTNVDKKVNQWLACESILLQAQGDYSEKTITNALTAAEPNNAANIQYVVDSNN